jgi:hypothetical protein
MTEDAVDEEPRRVRTAKEFAALADGIEAEFGPFAARSLDGLVKARHLQYSVEDGCASAGADEFCVQKAAAKATLWMFQWLQELAEAVGTSIAESLGMEMRFQAVIRAEDNEGELTLPPPGFVEDAEGESLGDITWD